MINFFETDDGRVKFEVQFGYGDVGLQGANAGYEQCMFLTNIKPTKIGISNWSHGSKTNKDIIANSQGSLSFKNRKSLEVVIKGLNQLRDNMNKYENLEEETQWQ